MTNIDATIVQQVTPSGTKQRVTVSHHVELVTIILGVNVVKFAKSLVLIAKMMLTNVQPALQTLTYLSYIKINVLKNVLLDGDPFKVSAQNVILLALLVLTPQINVQHAMALMEETGSIIITAILSVLKELVLTIKPMFVLGARLGVKYVMKKNP